MQLSVQIQDVGVGGCAVALGHQRLAQPFLGARRQIAQRCERDAAYRVIVGVDIPDFRTISTFRKTHLEAFAQLFVQVLQIARQAGLA